MPKAYGRMSRINEEIRRECSEILREEVKDPRLSGALLSVLKTDTTQDLKYCKIYISILGNEEARKAAGDILKKAAGFIRRELAHRLNLRSTPELTFIMDDSIEYSIHIAKLLKENAPSTPAEDEQTQETAQTEETEQTEETAQTEEAEQTKATAQTEETEQTKETAQTEETSQEDLL